MNIPNVPRLSKLSNSVYRVLGLNPGTYTLGGTNCYLLGNSSRKLMIDTGEGIPEFEDLFKQAMKESCTEEIDVILITHYHHDHVQGVDQVERCNGKSCRLYKKKNARLDSGLNPKHVYQDIKDGDVFKVPGATVRAIHTPGHCADHVAFYLEEEHAIFAGDCVLGFGTTVFDDLKEYMESIQKLLKIPEIGVIYPGHGPVVENGRAKLEEYYQHRLQREQQIVEVLHKDSTKAMTIPEIVAVIYAAYPPNLQKAAESNVHLHLEKLFKDGVVSKQDSSWILSSPKL